MSEESEIPTAHPKITKRNLFTPHIIALVIMWFLSTVSFVVMLLNGVRNNDQFRVMRDIIQVAYVLALFWYLIKTGPSVKQLPDLNPVFLPKLRISKLIPVIGITLLFIAEFFGQGLLLPLLMLATIWILIAWRRDISLPAVLLGLGLTTIAFLAGLPFYQNQYLEKVNFIVLLVFVTPMFVVGGLLGKRSGLVGSQLYTRRYREGVKNFLCGCVLFIPLGLANAASGAPDPGMTWVTHWWIPFSQPWFSGIVEEAWFRLFLVSLCYWLLQPAFNKRPSISVIYAVLFSGITFGLGHGGTLLDRFVMIGLLFGLPMAIVFIKRDWEHAVGAHYIINMIPTLMVFLETI
ncbi:MAG: CPBP family intramembrane metalloprotease [Anaerolineaceae bacterium]|nr:CPBP family intramembrane metalloprotease [Anaerolineaceae bacterium]